MKAQWHEKLDGGDELICGGAIVCEMLPPEKGETSRTVILRFIDPHIGIIAEDNKLLAVKLLKLTLLTALLSLEEMEG